MKLFLMLFLVDFVLGRFLFVSYMWVLVIGCLLCVI